MTITNTGKTPDKVSCVSSDASAECQIHTMTMNNGVMQMRPVEGGLEIKPGETVTLKPGGLHVMLVNLKHPLEQGKTVKATLKFDSAGTVDVDYPVAAIGAAAPGVPAGGGTMQMQGRRQRRHADEQAVGRRLFPGRSAAHRATRAGAQMMRCRPGIVTNSEPGTIPDQRCTVSRCTASGTRASRYLPSLNGAFMPCGSGALKVLSVIDTMA